MFPASSFSKITTMTWSGVGTSARPATFGAADPDEDEDEDPDEDPDEDDWAAGGAPLDPHPLSTARATTAAAVAARRIRTLTRASVPLGTDGKGRPPPRRCGDVSSASGDRVVD